MSAAAVVRKYFLCDVGTVNFFLRKTLQTNRSTSRFPDSWPSTLSSLELCVETESSPLMLDPAGVFVVPANCSAGVLVKFVSENMAEAMERMEEHRKAREEEEEVGKIFWTLRERALQTPGQ